APDWWSPEAQRLVPPDLIEPAAGAEVRALHTGPAAEVRDGRELEGWEAGRVARGNLAVARPVEVPRDDLLAFLAVEIVEVRHRHLARAPPQRHLVDHRHRRLGEDAHRRDDDLESVRTELAHREHGLVLPGDEHITESPLHEGRGCPAGSGVEHR